MPSYKSTALTATAHLREWEQLGSTWNTYSATVVREYATAAPALKIQHRLAKAEIGKHVGSSWITSFHPAMHSESATFKSIGTGVGDLAQYSLESTKDLIAIIQSLERHLDVYSEAITRSHTWYQTTLEDLLGVKTPKSVSRELSSYHLREAAEEENKSSDEDNSPDSVESEGAIEEESGISPSSLAITTFPSTDVKTNEAESSRLSYRERLELARR